MCYIQTRYIGFDSGGFETFFSNSPGYKSFGNFNVNWQMVSDVKLVIEIIKKLPSGAMLIPCLPGGGVQNQFLKIVTEGVHFGWN